MFFLEHFLWKDCANSLTAWEDAPTEHAQWQTGTREHLGRILVSSMPFWPALSNMMTASLTEAVCSPQQAYRNACMHSACSSLLLFLQGKECLPASVHNVRDREKCEMCRRPGRLKALNCLSLSELLPFLFYVLCVKSFNHFAQCLNNNFHFKD